MTLENLTKALNILNKYVDTPDNCFVFAEHDQIFFGVDRLVSDEDDKALNNLGVYGDGDAGGDNAWGC